MTTKTFTKRDSATAALRKAGVDKSEYNNYITKNDDGTLTVTFPEAAATPGNMFAALVKKPAKAEKPAPKSETPAKAKKAAKNSVSETIRDMIRAGKSNQEIFDKLSTGKNAVLDDTKKHYPGWYRCELRRKGEAV